VPFFRKQDGCCTALQHGRQSEENTRSNKISINEAPKVLITMVKYSMVIETPDFLCCIDIVERYDHQMAFHKISV
jgi:hypothetical protein